MLHIKRTDSGIENQYDFTLFVDQNLVGTLDFLYRQNRKYRDKYGHMMPMSFVRDLLTDDDYHSLMAEGLMREQIISTNIGEFVYIELTQMARFVLAVATGGASVTVEELAVG